MYTGLICPLCKAHGLSIAFNSHRIPYFEKIMESAVVSEKVRKMELKEERGMKFRELSGEGGIGAEQLVLYGKEVFSKSAMNLTIAIVPGEGGMKGWA